MKIDLKKLAGNYGDPIPFEGTADLSGEEMYAAYPFQHPVTYSGRIENHLGVLRLTGTIKTIYSTCCARCLKPLDVLLTAETDTLLTRDETAAEHEDEVFLLTEDSVEVEDILVPALLLQVEMTYLCDPDCKGLCPICGADRNQVNCGCDDREIDPRLAVLESLLKKKGDN